MADLAAADVTYTLIERDVVGGSKKRSVFKLVFGDGALTYPAGGVPLTKSKLGLPVVVESLVVYDSGTSGYRWTYDKANEKLVAMQAPAQTHSHDISLKNAAVADSAGSRVNAGANLLGANTGGDLTVAGGGANGGVVSKTLAAAALVEPSAIAIAAQTLYVEAVGW